MWGHSTWNEKLRLRFTRYISWKHISIYIYFRIFPVFAVPGSFQWPSSLPNDGSAAVFVVECFPPPGSPGPVWGHAGHWILLPCNLYYWFRRLAFSWCTVVSKLDPVGRDKKHQWWASGLLVVWPNWQWPVNVPKKNSTCTGKRMQRQCIILCNVANGVWTIAHLSPRNQSAMKYKNRNNRTCFDQVYSTSQSLAPKKHLRALSFMCPKKTKYDMSIL